MIILVKKTQQKNNGIGRINQKYVSNENCDTAVQA